jgi:phosphate transport system permease protein
MIPSRDTLAGVVAAALPRREKKSLVLSERASRRRRLAALLGHAVLFTVASASAVAVLFIFVFVAKDAIPFFRFRNFIEFFSSTSWYPSAHPPQFGAAAILLGSGLVTLGAIVVAVPLGISAAVCLSDVLPFRLRQAVKPVIELLAAIPSVAYGFFALIVLAPLLQEQGGPVLATVFGAVAVPAVVLASILASDYLSARAPEKSRGAARWVLLALLGSGTLYLVWQGILALRVMVIPSGTNALNASLVLGIMALPTIVSVSEDALQAAGRDLRMASYALGATRAETIIRVIIPAAISGITAAVILGIMRAIGETMVVWMASGNAAQIPEPWYNLTEPVRTLTATIAGDMGEADQVTGSDRYHVLFAMALTLLAFSFVCNFVSEWFVARSRRRHR